MAATSPSLQDQQQQTPGTSAAAIGGFGNIVPFILVMCFVAAITVVSCAVGGIYARRAGIFTPMHSVNSVNGGQRNWVEGIKRRLGGRNVGNAQVAGAAAGGCVHEMPPPSA